MTDKTALKKGDRVRMHLYLQSEAPRLGCGWRLLDIHVGTYKVKLTDPVTNRRARITREVFNSIAECLR